MFRKFAGFRIKCNFATDLVCNALIDGNEIINNYLERPERNISKLMDYARLLRVANIIEKYLQVRL